MIYEVSRKSKKLDIVLLDKAIAFASDFLDLDVDLIIEFQKLKDHQAGLCDYDEDETVIILSKNLSPEDTIRTLFHEMVHVKQYDSGRLAHDMIWEGKQWFGTYNEFPWELEAFELEEQMMKGFDHVFK